MDKQEKSTKKPDFKIVSILALACAILLALSLVAGINRQEETASQLPGQNGNNIHKLVISELMSNNDGVWVNDKNQVTDYLELYNGTSKSIDLSGYGLSDRINTVKWTFHDVRIEPGQYIVVGLTGKIEDGNNAAFKLRSRGGEQVILYNPHGKVVDAVDTIAMGKNQAMMRDADGQWFLSEYGTPGFANNEEGLEAYHASLLDTQEDDPLVINELLPSNKGNYRLTDGTMPGFVELRNTGSSPVHLSDYTLGKDTAVPFAYTLPDVTLSAGEIYRLYTGGQPDDQHTGFTFENNNGTVLLGKGGRIKNEVEYSGLSSGQAWIRSQDGSFYKDTVVSPGYSNDAAGIATYQAANLRDPDDLMINELMPSNQTYLAQNGDHTYDWIELKNPTSQTVSLAEYSLATNKNGSNAFVLPRQDLAPGEMIILMCSGNTALSNDSYIHTNFKLGSVDSVFLFHNGVAADSVAYSNVPHDMSYGRYGGCGWMYMEPTPLEENEQGYRLVSAVPSSTSQSGFYPSGPVYLSLNGPGTIYYTLDGTTPTTDSSVYNGTLSVDTTSVLKAISVQPGALDSEVMAETILVAKDNNLPVVSLTCDPDDFDYLNADRSRGLEIPGEFTLIETDGTTVNQDCTISAFGGNARSLDMCPWGIRFKHGDLEYHLFPNRNNSDFHSLVLRNGSTDYSECVIRDILATSLVDEYTDVDVQAYRPCAVYINGEYWGYYNIREKVNKYFIADHYNVSADSVNLLRIDGDVKSGGYDGYAELRGYAASHDLSQPENYAYMEQHMDMTNVCDYWIAESYTANNDIVNCRFFESDQIDSKWRYIFYDLDYAFVNLEANYYTEYIGNPGGIGNYSFAVGGGGVDSMGNALPAVYQENASFENDIIYGLLQNPTFQDLWLKRLAYNLENTWSTANVLARIDQMEADMKEEMVDSCQRWGLDYDYWLESVDSLRTWAQERPDILLRQTQDYFGLSDAEMRSYFGDLWS